MLPSPVVRRTTRPRTGRVRSRERGAVLVHVAVAMMGLLAFSALTIDLGALWVARAQAQNAADAGALAGGVSLAYVNPTDLDAAQAAATTIVQQHQVWGEPVAPASLQTSSGACPTGSPAVPGACLQVRVSRGTASGTPLPAFFSRLFGVNAADVTASASAKVMLGNATPCLRPLAIVDRWNDRYDTPNDGAWTSDDYFDGFDPSGMPNLPPGVADLYTPPSASATGTGITIADLLGQQVTVLEFDPALALPLRGNSLLSIDMPRAGYEGGTSEEQVARYEANMRSCSGPPTSLGATASLFHSHRPRYTLDPLVDLIDSDPGATWDPGRNAVVGSAFAVTPRIITVAVVDPSVVSQQDLTGAFAVTSPIRNMVGLFVQSVADRSPSAEVTGVIVLAPGRFDPAAPTVPDAAAFLRTVALVR